MGEPLTYDELAALCKKYAATGEHEAVTAEITTASDLADLLTDQLRKVHALSPGRPKGWQQLTCAPDVAEALARVMPEAEPRPRGSFPFPDIPIIVSGDSAPGTWRLVTHDGCEVRNADEPQRAYVSHSGCTAAEGRLA